MTTKSSKANVLCAECDQKALAALTATLQKAGYAVATALGRKAVEEAVRKTRFDAVVLGHTLSRDDRHHLPYIARKANADCRILVLHASGRHHEVDLAIDSRKGDRAILEAVAELLAREAALVG